MKKFILFLLLILSLVGCGKKDTEPTPQEPDTPVVPGEPTKPEAKPTPHSCVFDSDWKYDEVNHWKECQCGEKTPLEEHILELDSVTDSDVPELSYVCVCGYSKSFTLQELDTPILNIDEFGVVTWGNILAASHYNYIINDGEVLTTSLNTVSLKEGETISVQAVSPYLVSQWSYAVTYFDTSDLEVEGKEEVYVKFHNTSIGSVVIPGGSKVSKPSDPVKNNYTFDNWYADPFYQEVFDFNQTIYTDTIIYANFIPNDLVADTYFWIKGSPLISADVMSGGTGSNWHFIPLKENKSNTLYKEFYAIVTVTGATATNPAAFIVMDGFSDDSGRTYWKNGSSDFTINSDGVYFVYFSTEHQYASGIHINVSLAFTIGNGGDLDLKLPVLDTPIVSVDDINNIASWEIVEGASSYEVIINNGKVINTTDTTIELSKGSHITVRAVSDGKVSRWSLPKANRNVVIVDGSNDFYSVYFSGYDAYQVGKNQNVDAPGVPSKDGFNFGGWYLDYACTKEASFPYTVTSNIVFYPKWVSSEDYTTKAYYNLITEDGSYIKGLTWNLDNYTFDEYETGEVSLSAGVNYYIVSADDVAVKYGPYTVNSTGKYKIYFSEDNSWDGEHIYIATAGNAFYVTNNKRWTDTIYVYMWNSSSNTPQQSWPGVELVFVETNGYGEDVYKFEADTSQYDMFILLHGWYDGSTFNLSSQTIDLRFSDYTTNAFYFNSKDSSGKYSVGTWNK